MQTSLFANAFSKPVLDASIPRPFKLLSETVVIGYYGIITAICQVKRKSGILFADRLLMLVIPVMREREALFLLRCCLILLVSSLMKNLIANPTWCVKVLFDLSNWKIATMKYHIQKVQFTVVSHCPDFFFKFWYLEGYIFFVLVITE